MLSLLTRGRCSDIAGGRNWFWLLRHWSEVWVWERPVVFCLNHVPRMRCSLVTSQLWPRLVITFPGPRNTNITRSRPPFWTNARTPPPTTLPSFLQTWAATHQMLSAGFISDYRLSCGPEEPADFFANQWAATPATKWSWPWEILSQVCTSLGTLSPALGYHTKFPYILYLFFYHSLIVIYIKLPLIKL